MLKSSLETLLHICTFFFSNLLNHFIQRTIGTMADTAETDSLLGQDAFQTSESQRLFEAIDDLRRCGAKKEIDLPEVGDS